MKQQPDDAVVRTVPGQRSVLTVLYAGAVIVAGLYYGQELLVPLVLASLLAFVLAPICALLQRAWVPRIVAVMAAVILAFALLGGIGLVVGHQVASLASSLPTYQSTITTKWRTFETKVGAVETFTKDIGTASGPNSPAARKPEKDTGGVVLGGLSGLSIARGVALPILGPIGTTSVTLVFAFFILVSHEDLRDRLVRLIGRQDLHRTILALNDAAGRLSRFFLFQLALNSVFGLTIGSALWIVGLPNPLLWGILAAVMRFVPFIGVLVAAVPPLLLAIAIVPQWSLALLVLGLFAVAEALMGQVIEPLIYGHNTGLSPIAVIVATAFWALLWGPIGLLIATPLTVCLVVLGRHVAALAFIDVILGDKPPLEPFETFYQRELEGKALALAPAARKHVAATSYADYYDKIALPGLALAQGDLARDDAAFERLDAIHHQIDVLLNHLRDIALPKQQSSVAPTSKWQRNSAVLCIPGRGQLDDLAAAMAVQALGEAGFGAIVEPNVMLGPRAPLCADLCDTQLCCLSILEQGSTASAIRYFIRRVQKQMPDATIVVGLWHAVRSSELLHELRAGGGEEHLVLSIGELLAFCRALAARQKHTAASKQPKTSTSAITTSPRMS